MKALLLPTAIAVVSLSTLATAQRDEQIRFEYRTASVDSDYLDNPSDEPVVVFRRTLNYEANWLQLHFGATNLPNGSRIRLIAAQDEAEQFFDGLSLHDYSNTSATFNGGEVTIELVAGPRTQANRLLVDQVILGEFLGEDTVCDNFDDRVRSFDNRQGRLTVGCTGWLINLTTGLTAGHCVEQAPNQVLSFRAPLSTEEGCTLAAAPEDQYPWRTLAFSVPNPDEFRLGEDWAVGSVGRNSNTGLYPAEAYGEGWYQLGVFPQPLGNRNIRITGYGSVAAGSNLPLNLNLVQKTHVGPAIGATPTFLGYRTDTTGGNSGSPIFDEANQVAIGIHTNGGCFAFGGSNTGTRIDHPLLAEAIRDATGSSTTGFALEIGDGCTMGSSFTPDLSATNEPLIGSTLNVLASGLTVLQPGFLMLGTSADRWELAGADLPLSLDFIGSPECSLYVSPNLRTIPVNTGPSFFNREISIPDDQSLVGRQVFMQYAFADSQAGVLRTTNGLQIRIGG